MAGLYFHTPFCKRFCAYCDFPRTNELHYMDRLVPALHQELDARIDFLRDREIRTIYFGGGTPSLYAPKVQQELIDHARRIYGFGPLSEITIECNPDDMTDEYIDQLRKTEINRISIGVQSFDDDCLKLMNRRHTAAEAIEAVRRAQRAGFDNITIDLIYGIAGFGGDSLRRTIDTALSLNVQHISPYHLTIEMETPLGEMVNRGEYEPVDDEVSNEEFMFIHNTLTEAGYEHYEVSNYARPGFRACHNTAYWYSDEYLGIGPGAHSYNGVERCWCDMPMNSYFAGTSFYDGEVLTARDVRNEFMMTRLRTSKGIDLDLAEKRFGLEYREDLIDQASFLTQHGLLLHEENHLRIPPEKFMLSNAVIRTFFKL